MSRLWGAIVIWRKAGLVIRASAVPHGPQWQGDEGICADLEMPGVGSLRVDAGVSWGANPIAVRAMAKHLIVRQEYSDCLALLEALPHDALAGTCLVEDLALMLLREISFRNSRHGNIDRVIAPLEPRLMALTRSAIRAKSLDVPFDGFMGRYLSLLDYASRARERDEVMIDDPGFWPWLACSHPNISRFLLSDYRCATRSSSLIQMLSRHFRARRMPHSVAYMRAVDGLCREVMGICAGSARKYAKEAGNSCLSAMTEMAVLAAISRQFGTVRIEPGIPGGGKLADMGFEHAGKEHYVEVYSHAGYHSAVSQTKPDISPEEEWAARFSKDQIAALREAGVPTVYVMHLDDFQAQPGETGSPEFREAAARLMPPDSDIVVILHGIEAVSLRGGRVVEPSDVAVRLKNAIWEAMPENAPGVRP